jgi:hypothetical protein
VALTCLALSAVAGWLVVLVHHDDPDYESHYGRWWAETLRTAALEEAAE